MLKGALLAVGLLSGCASNPYRTFFSPADAGGVEPLSGVEIPRLVESDGFKELETYLNRGYVEVGRSAFNGPWASRTLAIDCARSCGASLVLVVAGDEDVRTETMVVSMPVYARTYDHGFVDGPRGYRYYSGSSTTHASVPVRQDYRRAYYNQSAVFLARRRDKSPFGLSFKLPKCLPGKEVGAILIDGVVPGSPAAARGIKRGDKLMKINGKPVRTEDDLLPFVRNGETIRSVEVSHE